MRKPFLILIIVVFLFPLVSSASRNFSTSVLDASTIRLHIDADTFANLIASKSDCGTAPPAGSWAFFFTKSGTVYQSSMQIHTKGTLDVDEAVILPEAGSYKLDLIWGSNATNWQNLYDVTSCNASDYTMNAFLGTTTIPLPVSSTSSQSSSTTLLMTTTTDLMVRNFLEFSYVFLYGILFFGVAYIIYKIVKR